MHPHFAVMLIVATKLNKKKGNPYAWRIKSYGLAPAVS